MKICWDMLEGVRLTKNGFFRKGTATYVYKESCAVCAEPYLVENRSRQSQFCGAFCAGAGKDKLSLSKNCSGSLNSNYKGGVTKIGLTTYEGRKNSLGPYENIRKQKGTEVLEVRCAYCNRWYTPSSGSVEARLRAINNLNKGECHLYCSENCKEACPIFNKIKYPKGFKHTTSREVSTYLRQIVLERDNWTCQICGKTIEEIQLHVHHMDPVGQNPMFQNDMDSCITLCKGCHGMVHKQHGCRYVDLRCKRG